MHKLTFVYNDGSTRTTFVNAFVHNDTDHAYQRREAHKLFDKMIGEDPAIDYGVLIDGTDGETLQRYCKGATF